MKRGISTAEAVLAGVVLAHVGVSVAHGLAHARANVALSPAAMSFVLGVIFVGPIFGLIAQRTAFPRAGAWVVAATLAGALVFGLVNHFVIPGADHVSEVAGPWRPLFGITATVLAVTEAFGSALAAWCGTRALAGC